MVATSLHKLAALIADNREQLLAGWRAAVRELPGARHLDTPTLNDHVPQLIRELETALRQQSETTIAESVREGTPPTHGLQRLQDGFDIEEVVAEYNILRDCVHDLADEHGLQLQGEAFRILNQVMDSSIGMAVKTYAQYQARLVQRRREEHLTFITHDLRTPLTAIAVSARVLETKLPPDVNDDVPRMLNTLQRNVQQLDGLVRKILTEDSALQDDGKVKVQHRSFELWPLVEGLRTELQVVAARTQTDLRNEVPFDLVVHADPGLIHRVLQNLLSNAIRYTERGTVTVGARNAGDDGAVECWVQDTGAGISPSLLPHVFDKGASDPDRPGGTGLGLSIVKTFVEAHGGRVRATNEKSAGSRFEFTLPGPNRSDASA